MKKTYKTSTLTNLNGPAGILVVLFFVGLIVYLSIILFKCDDGLILNLIGLLILGVITIKLIIETYLYIDERGDTVTLTDKKIKFHLHRQTFPYSLKAIDDEVRWKDIKKASFIDKEKSSFNKEKTTVLILTLTSGEVKEFGIGHMDSLLKMAIESHFAPEDLIEEDDEELDEDNGLVPGRPGSLVWPDKKPYCRLLVSALVGIIGTVLIAFEKWPVIGYVSVSIGLLFGCLFLYQYHEYNSVHIDPELKRKGRIAMVLGGLLLVCILVAAIIFAARLLSRK